MTTDKKDIYLDYHAACPLLPSVKTAVIQAMDLVGNPSSLHGFGRKNRSIISAAREELLNYLNLSLNDYDLIWTGSATEGINQVLLTYKDLPCHFSWAEHQAVIGTQASLGNEPNLNLSLQGQIEIDKKTDGLICLSYVQSESGIIQNHYEQKRLEQPLILCDAVQALGRINPIFPNLLPSHMIISFHKCGGPVGISALIYRKGMEPKTLIHGGGQQKSLRSGTENLVLISAVRALIAELRNENYWDIMAQVRHEHEKMEKELLSRAIFLVGENANRTGYCSLFLHPKVDASISLIKLDSAGIAVSSGSACSSGRVKTSPYLQALGIPAEKASKAIRITSGWNSHRNDFQALLKTWTEL